MLKFLSFLFLAPFRYRAVGIITLFVGLTLFFRYFELQPSGEKKDINVGPITLHVNSVGIQRRVAKPIVETNSDAANSVAAPAQNASVKSSTVSARQPLELPTDSGVLSVPDMPDGNSFDVGPLDVAPIDPSPSKTSPVRQSVSYGSKESSVPQKESKTVSFTPPSPINRQEIRIGTVCLNRMNLMKFSDPVIQETLVRTAQEFDLLAVQGFYDSDLQVIERWVKALNADGGTFSYLSAYPPEYKQDKNYQAPFVAFIFNRRAVDVDRSTLLILECGTRMTCSPIAALFTARSTDKYPAFTFIAMNVWIDPARASSELSVLTQTFPMLREYIRGEDDIVILGDFGVNVNITPEIVRNPKLNWAVKQPILNYYNQNVNSNILFYDNSCTEYQNKYGSFAVEKLTGLPTTQLREFIPNPPVGGVFSVREAKR